MELYMAVRLQVPNDSFGAPVRVLGLESTTTLTSPASRRRARLTVAQVDLALERVEAGAKALRRDALEELRRLLEAAEARELEEAEAARAADREARVAMVRPLADEPSF